MANLLLLLDWSRSVSESTWDRMLQHCRARSPFPGVESQGAGFRAFVAPTRIGESAFLVRRLISDGGEEILLLDGVNPNTGEVPGIGFEWTAWVRDSKAPFAGIRINARTLEIEVYRDLMGLRKLVYARTSRGLAIASGEDILLGHPEVAREFDFNYLAAFFSGLAPAPSETVFRGIRAVGPGESIRFRETHVDRCRRGLQPDESWRKMKDVDIVDRFGALLQQSVESACRDSHRIGVSLSAGLDSSSLAALASVSEAPFRERPFAVTQGFDSYPGIDERALAAQCAESLRLSHTSFAADALLPFSNSELRPICPDAPQQSPYREWKETAYRLMQAEGVDIMLSGDFGDYLFAGAVEWLDDALRHGRLGVAAREVIDQIARSSLRATLRDTAIRRPFSRFLGRVRHESPRLAWLREPFRESIHVRLVDDLASYRDFPRPYHAARLLDGASAIDAGGEQWFAQRHGIEVRTPFRDEELTRWCLSLPADFFQRRGERKWILREAMRGRLIDPVRLRRKSSDLTPIYIDSVRKQRAPIQRYTRAAEEIRNSVIAHEPSDPAGLRVAEWFACAFGSWLHALGH